MDGFGTVLNSFKGHWVSSVFNGDAAIEVTDKGLAALSGSASHFVSYAGICEIERCEWAVSVELATETVVISCMGQELAWLYRKLCSAYQARVLQALFVEDDSLLSARGSYRIEGIHGVIAGSEADIELFADCFCVLPPNCSATRIPWYLTQSVETDGYEIRVACSTGSTIALGRLGYEHDAFLRCAETCRRTLTAQTAAALSLIDPGLSGSAAIDLAILMPNGTGASLAEIARRAPTFPDAVAACLETRRAADEGQSATDAENPDSDMIADPCSGGACFSALRSFIPPDRLFVGTKARRNATAREGESTEPNGSAQADGGDTDAIDFWFVALDGQRRTALVEYAFSDGEQSATYLYRLKTNSPEQSLWPQINYALEAMGRNRECIRLTDDELRKPHCSTYAMALQRMPPLRFMRACLAGRIIHTSLPTWTAKALGALGA